MDATDASPEQQLERFTAALTRLREEVHKVVVGQDDVLDGVLVCLLAGGHALLEGVPGLGKTALVRSVAGALGLAFSRIQFTPDLMPADITGTQVLGKDGAFRFQQGPLFAHIVLADEINRTTPKTQSALLEAMQEHSVTVARTSHRLEQPFLVLATQNPVEMEGTYPLPEAQLDRFLLKLRVPFPSRGELQDILDRTTAATAVQVAPVLDRDAVLALGQTVRQVAVAPTVRDYVVSLLQATHPEHQRDLPRLRRFVRFGVSPRGGQAALLAAKVFALMEGRFHVSRMDVARAIKPAFRHRILLNFEGEAEGIETDDLLDDLLAHHRPDHDEA